MSTLTTLPTCPHKSFPEEGVGAVIKDLEIIHYRTPKESLMGILTEITPFPSLHALGKAAYFNIAKDTRERILQVDQIVLPATSIQLVGKSGSGKSMFISSTNARFYKKRKIQRGISKFIVRGAVEVSDDVSLSMYDENNSRANSNQYTIGKTSAKNRSHMAITHLADTKGSTFPYTLLIANRTVAALCKTEDFFGEPGLENPDIREYRGF